MAEVDADDDDIRRYVVRRYAYDESRRERRHMAVAAFDNSREFERLIDELSAELRARRAAGEETDPREHISGVVLQAGDRRRQASARLVRRAIDSGVSPSDEDVAGFDLPPNVARLRRFTHWRHHFSGSVSGLSRRWRRYLPRRHGGTGGSPRA